MAKQAAADIQDEHLEWQEFTSAKGKKYEVGFPKGAADAAAKPEAGDVALDAAEKKDFGTAVDWPVTGNWVTLSSSLQSLTGITDYKLSEYNGKYKYKLEFENTVNYDFKFFDETGDSYGCNTYRNGQLYVRYDSDKPKINYVKGD